MEILNYSELKSSINSGNIKNAYFIFGNDAYLKKQCVNKIIDKITDRSDIFNFIEFTDGVKCSEISEAAEQFPMMSEKKCVLLNDYDIEKADKQSIDALTSIIENLPETTVLIIWCNNIQFEYKKCDKAKKIAAAVAKCKGISAELDHPTPADLKRMLVSGAAKRGKTLSGANADYLVNNCGEDINILKSELEKLCGYCEAEITREIIDKVTVKSIDASVFELAKCIFSLNTGAAIKLLDDLFYLKTEPAIILHSIFTAFIDTYRVYVGGAANVSLGNMAQDFGYGKREFVLSRMKGYALKMNDEKFKLCFNELTNADAALKSFSSDERTVIEELVIRLIYILSKGEKIDKA